MFVVLIAVLALIAVTVTLRFVGRAVERRRRERQTARDETGSDVITPRGDGYHAHRDGAPGHVAPAAAFFAGGMSGGGGGGASWDSGDGVSSSGDSGEGSDAGDSDSWDSGDGGGSDWDGGGGSSDGGDGRGFD